MKIPKAILDNAKEILICHELFTEKKCYFECNRCPAKINGELDRHDIGVCSNTNEIKMHGVRKCSITLLKNYYQIKKKLNEIK